MVRDIKSQAPESLGTAMVLGHLRARGVNLQHFQHSLQRWPLPSRLRTDRGGENVLVGRLMIERRGENRGSWIQGPSVHNQRVERLWRDLRVSCTQFFIDMFAEMEAAELLDLESPADIFALHYVFLPRVNKALAEFQQAWNHHGLRTEGGQTPLHLWASGMRHADDEEERDWSHYGVDFVPEPVEEGDENNVSITTSTGLSAQQQQALFTQVEAAVVQVAPDADPLHLYIQCKDVAARFINSA